MKLTKKVLLTVPLSLLSFSTLAEESVLRSLASCNASFFKSLESYPALMGIEKKVKENDFKKRGAINLDISYTTPEGIHLKQFVVNYIDFNQYKKMANNDVTGEFYYWGFKASNSLDTVVEKFPVVLHKDSDDLYTANAKIRNKGGKWMDNKSLASGIAPGENFAEKLFLAEKTSEGDITLYCSVQGNISDADIKEAGLKK